MTGAAERPSLYGYEIDSDLPLIRCRPAPAPRGELRVRRADHDLLARQGELVAWDEAYGNSTLLATAGRQVLLWCSITGTYAIDAPRGLVEVQPSGEAANWEHRLAATVLPLLLSERGDLALHAAVVESGDGAIAFCGQRGAGKSTLAAALALRGHAVLSEDGLVLSGLGTGEGPPVVWPGPDGVRIAASALPVLAGEEAPGHAGNGEVKSTHLLGGGAVGPRPLRAVVVLGRRRGEEPILQRVAPVQALPAVVPHALFRGPGELGPVMARCAALVTRTPVFAGTVPDRLAAAPDNACALLELLARARGPGAVRIRLPGTK